MMSTSIKGMRKLLPLELWLFFLLPLLRPGIFRQVNEVTKDICFSEDSEGVEICKKRTLRDKAILRYRYTVTYRDM